MMFPYEKRIDITGESTVQIIIKLIKYCQNMDLIEQEKIEKLRIAIENNEKPKRPWRQESFDDDDNETH